MGYIEDRFLPEGYSYHFLRKEIHDNSGENFKCELRINISNEIDWESWLCTFQAKSHTKWNVRDVNVCKEKYAKYEYSKDYVCHYSSRGKTSNSKKNLKCLATLTIRIKKNNKDTRYRDKFVAKGLMSVVNLKFIHTHIVNAKTWNLLKPSKEIAKNFGIAPPTIAIHMAKVVGRDPDDLNLSTIVKEEYDVKTAAPDPLDVDFKNDIEDPLCFDEGVNDDASDKEQELDLKVHIKSEIEDPLYLDEDLNDDAGDEEQEMNLKIDIKNEIEDEWYLEEDVNGDASNKEQELDLNVHIRNEIEDPLCLDEDMNVDANDEKQTLDLKVIVDTHQSLG